MQVVEDVAEGYNVSGLGTRAARNATELRAGFNYGRSNRDTQVEAKLATGMCSELHDLTLLRLCITCQVT